MRWNEIAVTNDPRPFFGFVALTVRIRRLLSPVPLNRTRTIRMGCSDPILGSIDEDQLDEEIPYMRYAVGADAINPAGWRESW